MRRAHRILALFVLLATANPVLTAKPASAATPAQCNTGLTLTETVPLSFGGIMDTGIGGGTVSVDTSDLATYTSTMAWGVELPATGQLDINVTQTGNCNHVQSITVSQNTPLTDPVSGQTMSLSAFVTSPADLSGFSRSKVVLFVGATLTVNNGQAAGAYTGSYDVIYVFQ